MCNLCDDNKAPAAGHQPANAALIAAWSNLRPPSGTITRQVPAADASNPPSSGPAQAEQAAG